ncbi:MAG: hypothetical protein AMJ67_17185 [Betaproteobacteria bacterium SG8_41]|nr:MAG: hypothetical protein AMJ67_17185 [Betaproteobacteria bacterium SG8_41]
MNALFVTKVLVSALAIAVATELAKKDVFWGAVLIALPLASILAMSWLYVETRDDALVTRFARDVLAFLLEPRTRLGFLPNLLIGTALLGIGVWGMRRVL